MSAIVAAAGCATAPTQEMSDARQAVQAARVAGAPVHTPVVMDNAERQLSHAENELRGRDYKTARDEALAARLQAVKARNMTLAISQSKEAIEQAREAGALTQVTLDWLAQAQAAADVGDEQEALRAAQRAKQEAQDDIRRFREERFRAAQENQAWLEKAKPLLDEIKKAASRLNNAQQEALRRGEEQYQQGQGLNAYDIANALAAEVSASPPEPLTQIYEIQAGDTLWKIAARKSVYGNPLWWPLIYRNNRDSIPNADTLAVGQILTIELEPDEKLVEQAVRYARLREGAQAIVKKMDKQFLRDSKQ